MNTQQDSVAVLRQMVAEMVNFADVADRCALTEGNASVAIRSWSERLTALQSQQVASADRGEAAPSSRWSEAGEPDPHGDTYDCERAALAMGDLTDDELANAVFLHGNEKPSTAELMLGTAPPAIAYLMAAKDRIRWLSRKLAATPPSPAESAEGIPAVPYAKHEREVLAVIDERDRYHEAADELAAMIARITGEDIGEHSSANNPWTMAKFAAEEYLEKQSAAPSVVSDAMRDALKASVEWMESITPDYRDDDPPLRQARAALEAAQPQPGRVEGMEVLAALDALDANLISWSDDMKDRAFSCLSDGIDKVRATLKGVTR